ncbi:MAG: dTDP-4-dehydrorhamnose reductase [Anaerolineae bacterium]
MRLAITGAWGQLGRALQDTLDGHEFFLIDLPDHDVTDNGIIPSVADFEPDLVIHTAAMTDVDGCETNPDLAYKVNGVGTRNVALACQRCQAPMLYMSTDYVFDGSREEPYLEYDEPNPINEYARSKLAGEEYVRDLLNRFYIVRTAWLYSTTGKNFVGKILELAEEQDELSIVSNEFGSPTYAPDLAEAIAQLIQHPLYGIYHLVNEGTCSRYEFAAKILELAGKGDFPLRPIEKYARPAKVPRRAVLRNFSAATQLGITLRPWEEALRGYFKEKERAGHS